MKETESLNEIQLELNECLLHAFTHEGKPLVHDINDYRLVQQMITSTKINLIAEKSNLSKILTRFLKISVKVKFQLNFQISIECQFDIFRLIILDFVRRHCIESNIH